MIQLDGSAQDSGPSAGLGLAAAGSTSNPAVQLLPGGTSLPDGEFGEDVVNIARLARPARLSKARRDARAIASSTWPTWQTLLQIQRPSKIRSVIGGRLHG